MSIIIEDKDDIELLLFFFEQFNLSKKFMPTKADVDADADLHSRINKIEKWTVEQANAKGNFARNLLNLEKKVNQILELVSESDEGQDLFDALLGKWEQVLKDANNPKMSDGDMV